MRRHRLPSASAFLALLALVLAGCTPDPGSNNANGCDLQQLASVPLTIVSNRPILTVVVDGASTRLLLDTGSETSMLSEAAARRMALQVDWNQPVDMIGVGGYARMYRASIDRIAVGDAVATSQKMVVNSVDFTIAGTGTIDGLLGGDFLRQFDVDLNLPGRQLTLYRGRSCPSANPPWSSPYAAIDTPAMWTPNSVRPFLPVSLDGHPLIALMDTGATGSVVSAEAAREAGVTDEALAANRTTSVQGVTPGRQPLRLHRFHSLTIGADTIRNPTLPVTGEMALTHSLLLGMDYLTRHRVWISYRSQKLFFAAAPPDQ